MINSRAFIMLVFISCMFAQRGAVVGAISSLNGNATVKAVGTRKYIPAYKGQMLKNGDWMRTSGEVFVGIVFLDGSNIKLQQATEVKITSYRMTAQALRTELEVAEGEVYSNVTKQASGEFTVKTPTATASVKGTEFNLEYDPFGEVTGVVVSEGSVTLENEFGFQDLSEMQSSTASADSAPQEPQTVEEDELPTWQEDIEPELTFKLSPDKTGRQPVNNPIKVIVQALDLVSKNENNSVTLAVTVSSESEGLEVSNSGSGYGSSAEITLDKGKGVVYVKASRAGDTNIIANADNAESTKLDFQFFISQSQKNSASKKLGNLAQKNPKLAAAGEAIEWKTLKSAAVQGGTGESVEDVLQKVDSGEYQVEEVEYETNDEGVTVVRMLVKPN